MYIECKEGVNSPTPKTNMNSIHNYQGSVFVVFLNQVIDCKTECVGVQRNRTESIPLVEQGSIRSAHDHKKLRFFSLDNICPYQ